MALRDTKKQERMADAIATGIAACLYVQKITEDKSPASKAPD